MDKEQTEVDVKLQLRVGDVEFWKGELDNKLAQIKEEIEEAVGDVLTFANPVCSRSPNHLLLAKTIEMGNLRPDIFLTKELFQANLKIRVDGEGRSITEPINISQQCIVYRGGRQGCDLIRDEVRQPLCIRPRSDLGPIIALFCLVTQGLQT